MFSVTCVGVVLWLLTWKWVYTALLVYRSFALINNSRVTRKSLFQFRCWVKKVKHNFVTKSTNHDLSNSLKQRSRQLPSFRYSSSESTNKQCHRT